MAESIFDRVLRLVSGRIEDTVDRMEAEGGDTVMREAIREVDRAIDDVRASKESAMARRLQAQRQQQLLNQKIEELTAKAKFALSENREDLAEAALTRQVDFEAQIDNLGKVQSESTEVEARLEENMTALKTRKQQMQEALSAYMISRQEAALGGDGAVQAEMKVERHVERAEAAFDRAMTGAGGVGFTRSDAATINAVAELDGLHKKSSVAERLAALKAEGKKAA